MLASHWGFEAPPFRDPSGDGFYRCPGNEEALARLHFLVDNGSRFGILLGESGVGKTTVLARFERERRQLANDIHRISLVGNKPAEFVERLCSALSIESGLSVAKQWQRISDHIRVNGYQNITTVLLLDDIDQADACMMPAIVRLVQSAAAPTDQFTIIAAACHDQVHLIGRRLIDLSSLRVEMWPWSQEESVDFVQRELRRVGRTEPAFDEESLQRMHQISSGNPRRLAQLAHLVLAAGAGQSSQLISAEFVESVASELQLPAVPALQAAS